MKNNQSVPKTTYPLTNMLIQLLQWLTQLELSASHRGENYIWKLMPKLSCAVSINGNEKYNNHPINKNQMKPNNQLTNMLMQLLHWISHLELSEGHVGGQDIVQLLPMPALADSINGIKEINNYAIK